MTFNTGRAAIYWSWYCSPRRAGMRSFGRRNIGNRAYNHETMNFGEYPGWHVMVSHPHQRYGMAAGRRGARRKVHLVRDQIVAKTKYADDNPEQVTAFGLERSPLGILPDPSDIAEAAAFLAGDGARTITGEILNVASGTYMRS